MSTDTTDNRGRQPIPTEDLLTDLRRIAYLNTRVPRVKDVEQDGNYSINTYKRRFGSWTDALKEAGFSEDLIGATSTIDLLDDLQRLYLELDRTPSTEDVSEHSSYSYKTYYNRFGGLKRARELADIDPPKNQIHSTTPLLEEIYRLTYNLDHTPTIGDVSQHGSASGDTYYHRFGSWGNALELAGFTYPSTQARISDQELLDEVRRLADELGRHPRQVDMDKHGQYSVPTYSKRFGTWSEVLTEVEMHASTHNQRVFNDTLLDDLRKLADELGRTPRWQDMERDGPHGPKIYNDRFDSWTAALEKAGLETNSRGDKIPDDVLFADLQRVAAKLEKKPNGVEYKDHGHFSTTTVKDHFDSIVIARYLAGINDDGSIDPEKDLRDTVDFTPYIEEDPDRLQNPTREDLIDELHRLYDECGKVPSLSDLRNYGRCSHAPFYTKFGDWVSALEAAGFDVSGRQNSN